MSTSGYPVKGHPSESSFTDSHRWFYREFHAGCPSIHNPVIAKHRETQISSVALALGLTLLRLWESNPRVTVQHHDVFQNSDISDINKSERSK